MQKRHAFTLAAALAGIGALAARVLDRFGLPPRRQRHLLWAAWSLNYLLYWALKDW